jgi:hypothetical protein
MIVEAVEDQIRQICSVNAELQPIGDHCFAGQSDAQRLPFIDLLDSYDIGRGWRLVGRFATPTGIGDLDTIEVIHQLVEVEIADEGSQLGLSVSDEIIAEIGHGIGDAAVDLGRKRVGVRGAGAIDGDEAIFVGVVAATGLTSSDIPFQKHIPWTFDPAEQLGRIRPQVVIGEAGRDNAVGKAGAVGKPGVLVLLKPAQAVHCSLKPENRVEVLSTMPPTNLPNTVIPESDGKQDPDATPTKVHDR